MPRPPERAPGTAPSGKPRCKNYGCQCEFDEARNSETACRHHRLPPVFHDTRKWWSCCETIKVYSFDEMMEIPGCVVGPHSTVPPAAEVKRSSEVQQATKKVLDLHMAAEKPTESGRAPPPKQDFAPSVPPPKPKPKVQLPEGQARCKHYGCQNQYTIAQNHANACRHHPEPPLFHEGRKQWTCCNISNGISTTFSPCPAAAPDRTRRPTERARAPERRSWRIGSAACVLAVCVPCCVVGVLGCGSVMRAWIAIRIGGRELDACDEHDDLC